MRLPNAVHESGDWRIREVVPDFTLEDAWALPVQGDAEDFQSLLDLMAAADPATAESTPTRLLWSLRDRLGRLFDLGRVSAPADGDGEGLPIPGTSEISVAERLPAD